MHKSLKFSSYILQHKVCHDDKRLLQVMIKSGARYGGFLPAAMKRDGSPDTPPIGGVFAHLTVSPDAQFGILSVAVGQVVGHISNHSFYKKVLWLDSPGDCAFPEPTVHNTYDMNLAERGNLLGGWTWVLGAHEVEQRRALQATESEQLYVNEVDAVGNNSQMGVTVLADVYDTNDNTVHRYIYVRRPMRVYVHLHIHPHIYIHIYTLIFRVCVHVCVCS